MTGRSSTANRPVRILVTGGFGYIGGRLVASLAEDTRFQLRVLTRRVPETLAGWAERLDVVRADVTEPSSLAGVCRETDVVVHLAALDEVECTRDPAAALLVNALGTYHVLQEALRANVRRFIYFSTLRVYGDGLSGMVSEALVPAPTHHYGITHLAAEHYVRQACASSGMKGVSVRLSNPVGAPLAAGVDRWSLVANDLCRQAAASRRIVLRSSGLQHRDFLAMSDVVAATKLLATVDDKQLRYDVLNLGSGASTSVLALARLIQATYAGMFGAEVPLEAPPPSGQEREVPLLLDVSRLTSLGFSPAGDIKEELRHTLRLCAREFASSATPS